MGLWQRLTGGGRDRAELRPLYEAVTAEARRPEWYTGAAVPDTLDGRFDMLALVLSLVLIRLEREGAGGRDAAARLTEVFIDDMDGTMRELGHGDLIVGKRVGALMSQLGGRLGAYRGGVRREALVRNLYRGQQPAAGALTTVEAMVGALEAGLAIVPYDALLAGRLT